MALSQILGITFAVLFAFERPAFRFAGPGGVVGVPLLIGYLVGEWWITLAVLPSLTFRWISGPTDAIDDGSFRRLVLVFYGVDFFSLALGVFLNRIT